VRGQYEPGALQFARSDLQPQYQANLLAFAVYWQKA
jgi:hypothetical protein